MLVTLQAAFQVVSNMKQLVECSFSSSSLLCFAYQLNGERSLSVLEMQTL